ncbi:MAG: C1 family peptidase [Polyangiaceae bacterium]
MLGGSYIGQMVGLTFGEYLGRQIALSACRDDSEDDDFERRPFRPSLGSVPGAVDLRPWMTPVEEQGTIGSCTANALAAALEYLIFRERRQHIDLSRLFIYFNQRLWDDRVREDSGASLVSGIRVLSRAGVPREASWPYDRDLFAVQPPEAVFQEASEHRVTDWWYVPIDGDALRGCLAAGFPVAFGTRVTQSFVNTPRTGLCGMPSGADARKHGRHALLLVGYDDSRRLFIVKNSWGDDWGDRGYVYMPYAYVLDPKLTQSGWAIRVTTRDSFDPREPPVVNARLAPKAPPEGSAGGTRAVASVANMGAQVAVGALTGSSLLGGLAGGLVAGMAPGLARVMRGRDRGAFMERDRGDEILALLRGAGAPAPSQRVAPWTGAPPVAVAPVAPVAPATRVVAMDFVTHMPNRIAEVWRESGGKGGSLGAPVSEPERIAEDPWSGSVVRFEHGAVFAWDPPRDAPATRPFVVAEDEASYRRWLELGAAHSPLGFPIAPVQASPDGQARVLWCTRGAVIDRGELGAFSLFGSLFSHWRALGGFGSDLGYPVADPVIPEDPREPQLIRFERGTLGWTASRGAFRK